jgi:mannose-6-phosphate isomerase
MPYAWGSRSAIAELMGRATPTGPEAEMWMGAHAVAPSTLTRDGRAASLSDIIERDPKRELGDRVHAEFGARLPFLLKVLAAAEPLSLQAHPNAAQARAGYDDEERRGIPRDAPHRNYRDPSHKPELVCALTPFEALCGFRRVKDTIALFESLSVPALAPVIDALRKEGLRAAFHAIMTSSSDLVHAVVDASAKSAMKDAALAPRLAALYPGDVGVVSALLLNQLTLSPGEAIYLGAGNLHAYLGGTAVEVMASSDNVLRGGLTKKHMDVAELVRVLDFEDGPVRALSPHAVDSFETVYDTPAREFRLSKLRGGAERETFGPEILLCTEGSASIGDDRGTVELARGRSVFVPACARKYAVRGDGVVYRATTNLL